MNNAKQSIAGKKSEQRQKIHNLLEKYDKVTTEMAVTELGTSESTVRRLFCQMADDGEVNRVYGGIVAVRRESNEYHFENIRQKQRSEKYRIGEAASTLVRSGEIIFIDSGTTAQQFAACLAKRLKTGEIYGLKVFTNSLVNIETLSELCEVYVLGGMYRKNRQDFCGYITDIVLDTISFNKSFIGADGVFTEGKGGVCAADLYTSQINRLVIANTRENFAIIDSTKFNRRSLVKYCTLDEVNTFITDTKLPEETATIIRAKGPEVILV